jgi:release factor glutamine methyltransferase
VTSVRDTLASAARALLAVADSGARLEAEILLAEALGRERAYLHAWPEREVDAAAGQAFRAALRRRLRGEPIAYILGHREFWTLDLWVTPAVLIPRPETELLVELAIGAFPADAEITAADLGTGSGAVAAAVARERPLWTLLATDGSSAALEIARANFRRHGLANVTCLPGSWCEALPPDRPLDLIVSNPPYVAEADPHLALGDLRYEPREALAAGPDGLAAIRAIAAAAPGHLRAGGVLLLEHGPGQGAAVRGLLRAAGFEGVRTHRDLAGRERVSRGRRRRDPAGGGRSGPGRRAGA